MEPSHHSSDLDPSSILGFGSALALLDSPDEVGRLVTGALRSMGLADLQAVILTTVDGETPRVVGSVGTRPLPASVVDELRPLGAELSLDVEDVGSPTQHQIDVCADQYPALVEAGVRRLSVVRLGTVDHEFGLVVAGHPDETSSSSMQASTLQMVAAQASMALHRIRLNRQRAAKEEALRASEARYRELYENAPVAYVSVNGDAEIRMANQRAADLLRTSKDTLVGKTLTHFCADTDAAAETVQHLIDCIQENERLYDQDVQVCRADGEQVWISMSVQPIAASNGEPECLVMMVDVTERVEVETALREARDALEKRVDERTAELERTNDRLRRQTKRLEALREVDRAILAAESPDEIAAVAARRAQDIVPCERVSVSVIDRDEQQVRVLTAEETAGDRTHQLLGGGTTVPLEDYVVPDALHDGEADVIPDLDNVPLSGTAKKIRRKGIRSVLFLPMMEDGVLIGALKMGRSRPDAFTEENRRVGQQLADHLAIALRQSRLLEAVQEQRERLEERVQERTEELESFTYSVSHDLRTPLRAIDGYTRILKEEHADQLDAEGRDLLDVVYESAQTMGDLIDDLLTLSRLGRREMHRVSIDVEALAREACEELKRAHPERAEDVTFACRDLPTSLGDRSMIRQVLSNLLTNAFKFTREEENPHVEIDAEDRGDEVVYAVRDNGVGFSMEYADKLFGVFERLHDDFEGTGVGLALVERIVNRHGGRVWAEGEPGEGATMYFTLPTSTSSDTNE